MNAKAKLRPIFDVWRFPRARIKLFIFGPIRFGIQRRDVRRFRFKAPIRSETGIIFWGFLIDAFRLTVWIYIPAFRLDPPPKPIRKTHLIPKGR